MNKMFLTFALAIYFLQLLVVVESVWPIFDFYTRSNIDNPVTIKGAADLLKYVCEVESSGFKNAILFFILFTNS